MHWYYIVLAKRPYLIILTISIICLTCLIVSTCFSAVPDFTDPTLGFESRGTDIGNKLNTWYNLEKEWSSLGNLVADPSHIRTISQYFTTKNKEVIKRKQTRKKKKKKKQYQNSSNEQKIKHSSGKFYNLKIFNILNNSNEIQNKIDINFIVHHSQTLNTLKHDKIGMENFFCDNPRKEYSLFVVERIGKQKTSLFDIDSFLAICELQDKISNVDKYRQYCQTETFTNRCCKPWSLANYAALNSNKTSCFDLTADDVQLLQNLINSCFRYYHLKLNNECSDINPCVAPAECFKNDIVFNILHYLTDVNYIKINSTKPHLKYTTIFVPVIQNSKVLPLFYEWQKIDLKNDVIKVVAMDLGLENDVFNEMLLNDIWLVTLGGMFVLLSMWIYTSSLLLTIMSCIAVCFAIAVAYFLYTIIFKIPFFPYMNLLAIVVIIGIGADDVFIFIKIWQSNIIERFSEEKSTVLRKTKYFEALFAVTFQHAALSMFVTSITTALAFFASYISNITSIKCFSIFAGTAVVINFFLMLSWLPASISIMEHLSTSPALHKSYLQKIVHTTKEKIDSILINFSNVAIGIVIKHSMLWIHLFGALGLISFIIVIFWPGIKLPEEANFQRFSSNHPFELYKTEMKYEFWFEKFVMKNENITMPLRFVWGVLPIDDGDYTDPLSRGMLHYDTEFDVKTISSQKWLLQFCGHLRRQKFVKLNFGQMQSNCFIENFISLMNRTCFDEMSENNYLPCCNISKFPYDAETFQYCLPQIMSMVYATPRQFFIPSVAGPKFNYTYTSKVNSDRKRYEKGNLKNLYSPEVAVIVIEFNSNINYNAVYSEMQDLVSNVEEWFKNELNNAPTELRNGWFTSELKFFDVQNSLSKGTMISIIVAMCAALVVLFFITFNLVVSIYAVITVSLSILTTIAILILFGWTLGVLESVAISTAIGLTVDFSLHYSINYQLSCAATRFTAAQFAIERIFGPTAMAAITTIIAGLLMLASNVMPYIQIGIFLSVVMTVSWLYSTFFLISLLKVAGPQDNFIKLNFRKQDKKSETSSYNSKIQKIGIPDEYLVSANLENEEVINPEVHELVEF